MSEFAASKVQILINQHRYDEAEKMVRELLAMEPLNVSLLALLAEIHLRQDRYEEGEAVINQAIANDPDHDILFFIKAQIHIQLDKFDSAEELLRHAILLDPEDADYYAMLANLKLLRKDYQDAVTYANKALELNPENLIGLNTRSRALLKLNRKEDAFITLDGALREDPNNPYTHANYGWNLLEKGDHRKAREHFKEALTADPNMEYAQAGLMEAIKAGNPIYKLFLQYAFWIGNMKGRMQWAVIIGFYIGMRVLNTLANNNEALAPFLTPLVMILALIAFSTWVINPISNLFLRFNRYGKLLLDRQEKMSSNFVAASMGLFLIGTAAYIISGQEPWIGLAAFGFAMMVPLGVMFRPTKFKYSLIIYTAAMAAVGTLALVTMFATGELFNLFSSVFLIGFIGFQWAANFLMIRQSNR